MDAQYRNVQQGPLTPLTAFPCEIAALASARLSALVLWGSLHVSLVKREGMYMTTFLAHFYGATGLQAPETAK